jgi:hypothetical protein
LVNRDTRYLPQRWFHPSLPPPPNQTLEEALRYEMDWFVKKSGMTQFGALCQATVGGEATGSSATLNERGKRKLGLPALVGKIDTVVRQFMSEDYIPREVEKQQVKAEAKRLELEALGIKPDLAQIHSSDKFLLDSEEQLAKRAALEECLQDIHEVIREWKECLITLPTQGPQPGSQGKQECELPVKDAGVAALCPSVQQATSA